MSNKNKQRREHSCNNGALGLESQIVRIDHIALAVERLESTVAWYTGTLGFELVETRTTKGETTSMRSAVLRAGKSVVVVTQGTSARSQVSRFVQEYGPGVSHVALEVVDLDSIVRRLEALGGRTDTPVMEDVGIKQTFLRRDHSTGVRIELIERKGGAFTDRSVERIFRAFEESDLY